MINTPSVRTSELDNLDKRGKMSTYLYSKLPDLLSLAFIIYCSVCFLGGVYGWWGKSITFSDKFDLGYIREQEQNTEYKPETSTKTRLSRSHTLSGVRQKNSLSIRHTKDDKNENINVSDKQKTQAKPISSDLLDDCTLALIALGYRKGYAKSQAVDFLSKNKVENVEEFLRAFYGN